MTWQEALIAILGALVVVAIGMAVLAACCTDNIGDPVTVPAESNRGFICYSEDAELTVHYSVAGPGWLCVQDARGVWEFWQIDGTGQVDAIGIAGDNNIQVRAEADPVVVYWLRVE